MNPDAQSQLDEADFYLNDPDPEVRRQWLSGFADDLPRKRAPMPSKTLYVCGTDNDGWPTCQGDGTTCGLGGVCAELDPPPQADAPGAVVPPPDGFLMGASADEDDDEPPFVTAKYDGYCSACGEYHIAEGITMIRSDGNNGWEAEECAW
jgi:hypothetical protein